MTISIDSSASIAIDAASSATLIVTFESSAHHNVIVWAGMANGGHKITEVTDTAGLNFSRRALNNSNGPSIDYWTTGTIGNVSGTDNICVVIDNGSIKWETAAIVTSGNTTNNVGLGFPKIANHECQGVTPSIACVTTSAHYMLLGIVSMGTNQTQTAGSGYTILDTPHQANHSGADEYKVLSSNVFEGSVSFGDTAGATWSMIVDAIA